MMGLSLGLGLNATGASADYDAGSQTGAQIAAAIAAAANGSTVNIDPIAGQTVTISSLTKTNVTVTQIGGQPLARLTATGVSGITFDGVAWYYNNSAGADFSPTDVFQLAVANTSTMTFRNCSFRSPANALVKRFAGIRCTGSTVTVDDCLFDTLRDGFVCNDGTATVTGCIFRYIFEDGITGGNSDWTVEDNTATYFQGQSGKRYTGTITGTLTVGETLTNGLTGSAQKIIYVREIEDASNILGFYNLWAQPIVGETYTGASGSIVISAQESEFGGDGIHGDFFQPLMRDTSTADRTVIARRNFVYRSTPFGFDTLQDEQGCQGILMQLNGSSHNFINIDVSGNVFNCGQANGIVIWGARTGQVLYNTVISPEYGNPSRIRAEDTVDITFGYNAGNNGSGGVVVLTTASGPNTGLVDVGNVVISDAEVSLVAPYSYPNTLSGLAPAAGQNVDNGDAGALTVAAAFRSPLELPVITTPVVLGSTLTKASNTGSTTLTVAYTAPAGSNRRVIVHAADFYSTKGVNTITATWGGVAMTKLAQVAMDPTTSAFDRAAMFEIREANFPPGATGNIVITCSRATPANLACEALTIANIGTGSAVVESSYGATFPWSDTITPVSAGSLVIGTAASSVAASGADWTAGLTEFDSQHVFGSTATNLWGAATHGASLLTVTPNYTSGRVAIILAAFPPV